MSRDGIGAGSPLRHASSGGGAGGGGGATVLPPMPLSARGPTAHGGGVGAALREPSAPRSAPAASARTMLTGGGPADAELRPSSDRGGSAGSGGGSARATSVPSARVGAPPRCPPDGAGGNSSRDARERERELEREQKEHEKERKIALAQERKLVELERKVAQMTEQRIHLEQQADSQFRDGSAQPSSQRQPQPSSARRGLGAGARRPSDDGQGGLAGSGGGGGCGGGSESSRRSGSVEVEQLAIVDSAPGSSGGSSGSTCIAGAPSGAASSFLEEMRRDQELWESKVLGLRVGVSRPGTAPGAEPAPHVGAAADSQGALGDGGSPSRPPSGGAGGQQGGGGGGGEDGSAVGATAEAEVPEGVPEESTSFPPLHGNAEGHADHGGCGSGEEAEEVGWESLVAGALRAAHVEATSAEEAMAELLRRMEAAGGGDEGDEGDEGDGGAVEQPLVGLAMAAAESLEPVAEQRMSKSAKRWAAQRLQRKRSGFVARTPTGSCAAMPLLPTAAGADDDSGDDEA